MKTPRTDEAWRKYYDDEADEMDMKELMAALECEHNEEKANCRQAGVEALMQRDDLLKELAKVTAERETDARAFIEDTNRMNKAATFRESQMQALRAHNAELEATVADMRSEPVFDELATNRARIKELESTLEEAIDERANMYEWRIETNPDRWVRDGLCVKWRATLTRHAS